eukprot:Hpha_TRINITY_DN14893_c0_g2::TRINITY_DN14893_c0_g2_i1::g.169528::m.169528
MTVQRVKNHERVQALMFAALACSAVCFCFLSPWRLLNDAHGIDKFHREQDEVTTQLGKIADVNITLVSSHAAFLRYLWTRDALDRSALDTLLGDLSTRVRALQESVGSSEDSVRLYDLSGTLAYSTEAWKANVTAHANYIQRVAAHEEALRLQQEQYRLKDTPTLYHTFAGSLQTEIATIEQAHTNWTFQEDPEFGSTVEVLLLVSRLLLHESYIHVIGSQTALADISSIQANLQTAISDLHGHLSNQPGRLTAAELDTFDKEVKDRMSAIMLRTVEADRDSFALTVESVVQDPEMLLGDGAITNLVRSIRAMNAMYTITAEQALIDNGISLPPPETAEGMECRRRRRVRPDEGCHAESQDIDDPILESVVWPLVCAGVFTFAVLFLLNPWRPYVPTELKVSGGTFLLVLFVNLGIFCGMCGIAGEVAQKALNKERDFDKDITASQLTEEALGAAWGSWTLALAHLDESLLADRPSARQQYLSTLLEAGNAFAALNGLGEGVARAPDVRQVVGNATSFILPKLEYYGQRLLDQRARVNPSLPHHSNVTARLLAIDPLRQEADSRVQLLFSRLEEIGATANLTVSADGVAYRSVRAEVRRMYATYTNVTAQVVSYITDSTGGKNHPALLRFQEQWAEYDRHCQSVQAKLRAWTSGPPVPSKVEGSVAESVNDLADAVTHVATEAHRLWAALSDLAGVKSDRDDETTIEITGLRDYRRMLQPELSALDAELDALLGGWRRSEKQRMQQATSNVRKQVSNYRYTVVWTGIVGLWGLAFYWRVAYHFFFDGFTAAQPLSGPVMSGGGGVGTAPNADDMGGMYALAQ